MRAVGGARASKSRSHFFQGGFLFSQLLVKPDRLCNEILNHLCSKIQDMVLL